MKKITSWSKCLIFVGMYFPLIMLAEAEVEFVSLTFTPSTVDVGQSTQTLTFTAHLRSDADPIQKLVIFFEYGSGRSYRRESYQILPDHLITGNLNDGTFEASYQITNFMRIGEWKLTFATVSDSTGHARLYGRSTTTSDEIAAELGWPNLPETVQTDLTVIAPDGIPSIMAEYTTHPENVLGFGENSGFYSPLFANEAGEFFPSRPGSQHFGMIVPNAGNRRHALIRGDSRSFMIFFRASQHFADTDMFVFHELKPSSSGYLQPGIKVRVARYWTEDYFGWQGDIQRIVTPPIEDELPSGERYKISLREDGTNAYTWSTTVGFLVTPPPGGFTSDFVLAFGNHSYGELDPDSSGMEIILDKIAMIPVRFNVVDKSEPSIRFESNSGTADAVISWFGGVAHLPCHVQWSSTLEPDDWTTASVTETGLDGMLHWTDDGSHTAPMSEPRRFYRILVP